MDRKTNILNSIQESIEATKKVSELVVAQKDTTKEKSNINKKSNAECETMDDEYEDCEVERLEDGSTCKSEDMDFTKIEEMEEESPEMEMMEYKKDFYEMSLGSLRAIATHANEILNSLDMPHVKENLTESWLQGKIAITEDYMRTIHDFIMYVSEAADNISAADRPGLWENIRKKREKMGKNYRPAKPGEKDRPDPDQWKKLTK